MQFFIKNKLMDMFQSIFIIGIVEKLEGLLFDIEVLEFQSIFIIGIVEKDRKAGEIYQVNGFQSIFIIGIVEKHKTFLSCRSLW